MIEEDFQIYAILSIQGYTMCEVTVTFRQIAVCENHNAG